ncbi:hypothetical protein GWI33_007942 [Rhynchophorus ferrugineus]|uniref:Uncharacterized protein n=1 Tax=Rhynchophorus ferrugineus TaxID=354439 RepID=A0A834MBI6_RHYFE|nr:hypothetical protein GWI33_007942 [Rhynchophorus ferrugineus]
MTSGTASPTPNDSPSLSQRPLLTSRELGLRTKKTVEFQAVYKSEDDKFGEKWHQEHDCPVDRSTVCW